jgi:hypothetical protein
MYDMLKLFQTGRSHMVVLTDTPATARAAVEAAAKAAAAAAAAAAALEAASDSSSNGSGGGSPLAGRLKGKGRKSKRLQFESPLLQPIETSGEEDDHPQEQQQEAQQHSPHHVNGVHANGDGFPDGPFAANGLPSQQQGLDFSSTTARSLLRNSSNGSRSKGRVGFIDVPDVVQPVHTQLQQGDSSSSSSHMGQQHEHEHYHQEPRHIDPQQQQQDSSFVGPTVRRSSSGGGSSQGSSKNGLRMRSKSGPLLMSLAADQAYDPLADLLNGPEGVAVPIGARVCVGGGLMRDVCSLTAARLPTLG